MTIKEEAVKFINQTIGKEDILLIDIFIQGAHSESAKEYWYKHYQNNMCTCGGFPDCICTHLNK